MSKNLWIIHNKKYDLTNFLKNHPGGKNNLLLGINRDCTELFESVHSISNKNLSKILEKYYVSNCEEKTELFSWDDNGFYKTLQKKVRNYFKTQNINHKANLFYVFKSCLLFLTWITTFYFGFYKGYIISSILAGFIMNMMGFVIMHDASHHAISSNYFVNDLLCILWTNFNFWSHFLWKNHHIYSHHSYTGIFKKDVDLGNSKILIRKTKSAKYKLVYKYQKWVAFIFLLFIPGQHVGQSIFYFRSLFSKKLWSLDIKDFVKFKEVIISFSLYIPSLFIHSVFPYYYLGFVKMLIVNYVYWTSQNIGYFAVVFPNHDTIDIHNNMQNLKKYGNDWGVQQILSSGNHNCGKSWSHRIITDLWGGMNFQIEHHLFPTVSHVHYRNISKIVEETCKEFNIVYNNKSTWFQTLKKYINLLHVMSEPN